MDDRVISVPTSELTFTASRSGGAGGQHVNKTSSRITLRWNVFQTEAFSEEEKSRIGKRLSSRLTLEGDLLIHVDSSRSQHANRETAQERLIEILVRALKKPKRRVATRPSAGAKARRVDSKKKRAITKQQRQKTAGVD